MNMSKTDPKTDNKHRRALAALLEKGVAAIGLGAACLVVPSFLEPSSATASVAAMLRMAGWISIGVGAALLGLRFSVQSKARKLSSLPRSFPIASGPAPTLETKRLTQPDTRLQQ